MTVDQYAICPCGNGKKIKFCKCKDSLPELDRITTMLDGGQVVPALDRINRVLDEHPDAAWALAIKGRILLNLQEYSSLADNAERFVRLQPTNPLALTQRAASQVFRNQVTEATESILEALTESGRQVDSFVLEIVSVLAFALANSGQFLSARAYATLALSAEGFDGGRTAAHVLQELNTSPAINHLLKALPSNRPRPERVEWAERFDEALGLLRSNRIALAETKFASLARAYPGEPAILSGLLS
jgi:predicted Zn-dependent protease